LKYSLNVAFYEDDHDRHHCNVKTFVINAGHCVCVLPILGIHINVAFRYLTQVNVLSWYNHLSSNGWASDKHAHD